MSDPHEPVSVPETPAESPPSVDASRPAPSAHGKPGALPSATLDRAVTLALSAVPAYERRTGAAMWPSPSEGLVRAMLEAAAPVIAAGERERIAGHLAALAANYPEDVFPTDSGSRDAISGTAMRHAYRNAARSAWEAGNGC